MNRTILTSRGEPLIKIRETPGTNASTREELLVMFAQASRELNKVRSALRAAGIEDQRLMA